MKCFLFAITLFFAHITAFSHPILLNNISINFKEMREYEIQIKVNLAYLLCQDLISNFEKYDIEYKRLVSLSNEDFIKEVESRKKEILSKFVFGFSDIKKENSNLEIDFSLRKQQHLFGGVISEDLNHSDELHCTLIITGEISPLAATKFYWENIDFVKTDILKVVRDKKDELALIWVQPLEKKEISLVKLPIQTLDVIKEYVKQGFLHILPQGLDHILFMLCLFLLFKNWKTLLLQISVFTIAHSITLILVTLNYFSFKSIYVEPLIALSICVVGVENLFSEKINKYRITLIFLFGLLHGMGFADVLTKLGLPENKMIVSLISFNVGVELGQIAVVTIAYLLIGHWFYKKDWYRYKITIPCSIMISIYAFYLFITRLTF